MKLVRDWNELAILARVAERLSFDAAARDLGLATSTVSRKIVSLEERLGIALVHRTTRTVRLTAAGVEYAAHCNEMLGIAERADAKVQSHRDGMQGHLSVDAPTLLGRLVLAPIIAGFALDHPDVRVKLTLSNTFTDLIDDGVDIAFRTGKLPDSGLRVRRLAEAPVVIVASPGRLARHSALGSIADVAALPCVAFDHGGDQRWRCGALMDPIEVNAVYIANDLEVLRDAAIMGIGFALLPQFIVEDALGQGLLRAVEIDFAPGVVPLSIVFPGHKQPNACARALADRAVTAFARDRAWKSA